MPKPTGRHDDWKLPQEYFGWLPVWIQKLWPFQYIPRGFNSIASMTPPVQIIGNVSPLEHLDVPSPGQWTIAGVGLVPIPAMIAWQTKNQKYFRFGLARYTYFDENTKTGGYYTFPTASYRNYKNR